MPFEFVFSGSSSQTSESKLAVSLQSFITSVYGNWVSWCIYDMFVGKVGECEGGNTCRSAFGCDLGSAVVDCGVDFGQLGTVGDGLVPVVADRDCFGDVVALLSSA
jgi:hypothetical protein